MKRALITLAIGLLSTQAHAHHHKFHRAGVTHRLTWAAVQRHNHAAAHLSHLGFGPRPRAWCGFQMRVWMGVRDATYNLARAWAGYGHNAGGPAAGVIVVWPHHVGLIVGRGRRGLWIVKSGNDGHAVRERERSLSGAIAFRSPT